MSKENKQEIKQESLKVPSLDEIVKKTPLKADDEIEDLEYEDEDEEEEMDSTFLLEDFEKQFYDDEGNWISNDEGKISDDNLENVQP